MYMRLRLPSSIAQEILWSIVSLKCIPLNSSVIMYLFVRDMEIDRSKVHKEVAVRGRSDSLSDASKGNGLNRYILVL